MRRCEYIEKMTIKKNILEFPKHFSLDHIINFFGPLCMFFKEGFYRKSISTMGLEEITKPLNIEMLIFIGGLIIFSFEVKLRFLLQ